MNLQRAFYTACETGYVELVEKYISYEGVDPSENDNFGLILAIGSKNYAIIDLLLNDPRIDPSVSNNLALHTASYSGDLRIVKSILKDARVDPSSLNNEAIRLAARSGSIEVINELLKYNNVIYTCQCANKEFCCRRLSETTHQ